MKLSDYEYYRTDLGVLYCGDCLEILPLIEGKVDLVLTDPPYGITGIEWDKVEIFYKSIEVCIELSNSQIYFGNLKMANEIKNLKFEFIWNKIIGANFANVKRRPLKIHEYIFVCGDFEYYPIKTGIALGHFGKRSSKGRSHPACNLGNNYDTEVGYPKTILEYMRPNNLTGGGYHPTQKPIELLLYLINSFSKSNQIALDPFIGSGTTAVACEKLNRQWIGIEISEKYCEIAKKRIEAESSQLKMVL